MKRNVNFEHTSAVCRSYEAPAVEVVEISVERGFEASNEAGFDGPSYGEEDVEW